MKDEYTKQREQINKNKGYLAQIQKYKKVSTVVPVKCVRAFH